MAAGITEGDIERLQVIGRGAFGTVFKCRLRTNAGVYALKEIWIPEGTAKQKREFVESLREVDLLARLRYLLVKVLTESLDTKISCS